MSTFLVVDDEPDILMAVRMTLSFGGHAVVEAATGGEALERAKDHPDAVVLDLRLPDIDGLEVLRRLKEQPELRDIPVVILSAHSSPSTRDRAFELGCADYVNKPFLPQELRTTMERVTRAGAA